MKINFQRRSRKTLAAPLVATLVLLLFYFALQAFHVVDHTILSLRPLPTLETSPGPGWSNVRLRTADGLNLAAWYAPTANGATVVMLHGYGGNRSQILPEAEILREQGFGVLVYDTRAHGQSEGLEVGYGAKEQLDLQAALDWLGTREEVNPKRIGAYGFSMGGVIVARVAASDLRLRSLVLAGTPSSIEELIADEGGMFQHIKARLMLMAYESQGVDVHSVPTVEAVAKLGSRPVLFIAGEKDTVVPEARVRENFAAAGYPKTLVILGNSGHGHYLKTDKERYRALLIRTFTQTLLKN